MDTLITRIAVWALIGFFAQMVDGSLGMGYGVTNNSFLIAMGVAPALASASVHTAEIFTTLISGGSHFFVGNVKKGWLLNLIIPGVLAGAAGAFLLSKIPGNIIKPYVAGILLLLGLIMLYRFLFRKQVRMEKEEKKLNWSGRMKIGALALVAAFVDAIGGGGWGPVATPGLILSTNTEPRKVVGTVNLAEFFVTCSISGTFLLLIGWQNFNWLLVGSLMVAGMIAAPIAAFICRRLPVRAAGIAIGILIILYNLRTLLKIFFGIG